MAPKRTCSSPGCDKPHLARGLCSAHYARQRKRGLEPITLESRLWSRVNKDRAAPCWEWVGGVTDRGYGTIGLGTGPPYRKAYVHRLSYEIARGAIPVGLWIDHLCRNRRCVNPAHLEAVLPRVNTWRGDRAKLTPGRAERMRERAANGESVASLCADYGVSSTTVQSVLAGQSWRVMVSGFSPWGGCA